MIIVGIRVFFLKPKDQTLETLIAFCKMVENKKNHKINCMIIEASLKIIDFWILSRKRIQMSFQLLGYHNKIELCKERIESCKKQLRVC